MGTAADVPTGPLPPPLLFSPFWHIEHFEIQSLSPLHYSPYHLNSSWSQVLSILSTKILWASLKSKNSGNYGKVWFKIWSSLANSCKQSAPKFGRAAKQFPCDKKRDSQISNSLWPNVCMLVYPHIQCLTTQVRYPTQKGSRRNIHETISYCIFSWTLCMGFASKLCNSTVHNMEASQLLSPPGGNWWKVFKHCEPSYESLGLHAEPVRFGYLPRRIRGWEPPQPHSTRIFLGKILS